MRRTLYTLLMACALSAAPSAVAAAKGRAPRNKPASHIPVTRKTAPSLKLKALDTPGPEAAAANSNAPPPSRGPTRIDFDDRLIQGQTNKSGAVYLYDRKELKTRSMVHKRESFREEIVSSVYDS